VIGFALRWEGQEQGVLWISGDTVLYEGLRQVADRMRIGTAILHLGGVQFPISGPIRYSMTAQDAVELCRAIRPSTAIPIHYEGWKHFQQSRGEIERDLAGAWIGRKVARHVVANFFRPLEAGSAGSTTGSATTATVTPAR
jgi:L-ascorbate metabolism protein UlaG (beta-lactamase superfamily)